MKFKFFALTLMLAANSATAWDGFDWKAGTYIEIEKGDLVRVGKEVEYYDVSKGEYRTGEVRSIGNYGNSIEVKILDTKSGEVRTFDMEK